MRLGSMGSRSGWLWCSDIQFVGWRDKGSTVTRMEFSGIGKFIREVEFCR